MKPISLRKLYQIKQILKNLGDFGDGEGDAEADEDHVVVCGGTEFVRGETDAGVHGFKFASTNDADAVTNG